MAQLPLIPGDLIFKIIDISSTGEVLDKYLVYNSLVEGFPKEKFKYSAMINGAYLLDLPESKADIVFSVLKTSMTSITAPFQSVSIDVEPVYSKTSGYNSIKFMTKLIELINTNLNLPVHLYLSPAPLANGMEQASEYTAFTDALKKNADNILFLPAYTDPDPVLDRDITSCVSILNKLGIKYKLILALRSGYNNVLDRLNWIKTNKYDSSDINKSAGLCLFSIENKYPNFDSSLYASFVKIFYPNGATSSGSVIRSLLLAQVIFSIIWLF